MKKFALIAAAAAALLAAPASAQDKKWFAGPTVGSTWTQGSNLGFDGGYQLNKYLGFETTYDHVFNSVNAIDLVATNVVVGYPISGTKVTPYALTGLGYQFQSNANQGVWNVGAGLRVDLAKDVVLDTRYRYVQGMWNAQNENVISVGAVFKF